MRADVDAGEVQRVRVVIVEDVLVRGLGVRDDEVVVVARAQVGRAPRHVDDASFDVTDLDPVVDPVRLLEADRHAGEEVAQDGLQRESKHERCHR
ncbi:MAG: hypothetical protein NTY02_04175, partial [Acidobacteria bacterium]|nr:hypothetical protein [Acidobacteriota bacterium]